MTRYVRKAHAITRQANHVTALAVNKTYPDYMSITPVSVETGPGVVVRTVRTTTSTPSFDNALVMLASNGGAYAEMPIGYFFAAIALMTSMAVLGSAPAASR
jgi:hypothetical protein